MTDVPAAPYYEDDWDPADAEETLPRRPRRRLVTPLAGVFAAVLVAAAGFIGGVEVQRHHGESAGASTGAAAIPAGLAGRANGGPGGGFGGGGGGGQGNATVGSVANKHGSTLYVKGADGTTVRVKTTSHSKINRLAPTSAGAIHPGDTVIVQGTKSSSGTVTATQITATAAGAASGGLGGLLGGGGFGGGGGGGGAGPQGSGG